MRTTQEMFDLILTTASEDDRIRAVMLNGSRANPNIFPDIFQDFDIVYFVTEVESFKSDHSWIDRFGDIMILQTPDSMQKLPANEGRSYTYLMQFMDGNRIDLTLFPLNNLEHLKNDSHTVVLLDKDGLLPKVESASDRDYFVKPPTIKEYTDCCNEFWWICTYVAKGLWREEVTYAKAMLDGPVREQLMKMLNWYIGIQTDFTINPGKEGKYFKRYLPENLWKRLLKTFSDAEIKNIWDALLVSAELFRDTGYIVAEHSHYDYPKNEDKKVYAHLNHVRNLPKTANKIY